MYQTMQTPRANNDHHKLLPNDYYMQSDNNSNINLRNPQTTNTEYGGSFVMPSQGKDKNLIGVVPGGKGHHKKTSTISGDIMKDAVDDPMFIEELISGMDSSREISQYKATNKNRGKGARLNNKPTANTTNVPNILVDRATIESDFTNPTRDSNLFSSAREPGEDTHTNNRDKYRQSKLRNPQNNNLLTGNNAEELMGQTGRSSIRTNQGGNKPNNLTGNQNFKR